MLEEASFSLISENYKHVNYILGPITFNIQYFPPFYSE